MIKLIRTEINKRIYLSSPHMSGYEINYINQAFESNWIAPLGENVDEFEKEIAEFSGVKEAVAVSSGTAAIHLALSLLGVKRGDSVFCSSLTFVATANPILYQGATPVFIDSEPDTWNMSPIALERAFEDALKEKKLPKAVIIVSLYGQPAKMEELVALCNHYHVPIIEDAAESLGSTYKGKQSGSFGLYGIYSFNGNKIITTSGGGMLLSNDTEAMERARFLATQARDPAPYYQHSKLGFNYRLSNILAGIGRGQLQVIGERIAAKRRIFSTYYKELRMIEGLSFMPELEDTSSNRWLTTLTLDEKKSRVGVKELLAALEEENIEARHVWKPLHRQPLFADCKYYSHYEEVSISDHLFQSGICLPSGTNMSEGEHQKVINSIKRKIG